MSLIICPKCKKELKEYPNFYKCENNHCYDKGKQGYVNLLMSQKSSDKRHGDDKLMIKARTDFLNGGYYKPLLDELSKVVCKFINNNGVMIDCGCGEGYYTSGIKKYLLENGKSVKIFGTDISKDAVISSLKRDNQISYTVSSVAELPYKTACSDIILSVFAPYNESEFYRILKKDGIMIRVIPLEKHLYSLKEKIYDNPYLNVLDNKKIFGFSEFFQTDVKYLFTVSKEKLQNLFKMTPYYYKTSKEDQEKLLNIDLLQTQAEFRIICYKKD